jgi:hypothetical protein
VFEHFFLLFDTLIGIRYTLLQAFDLCVLLVKYITHGEQFCLEPFDFCRRQFCRFVVQPKFFLQVFEHFFLLFDTLIGIIYTLLQAFDLVGGRIE